MAAEQLDAHGAELCQRPVMSLFDNNASIKAAMESGTEPQLACADWEMTGGGVLVGWFEWLSSWLCALLVRVR